MPTDKSEEPKKKVVVVEEVGSEDNSLESQTKEEVHEQEVVQVEETPKKVEPDKTIPDATSEPTDEDDKPNYLWIIVPTALLVGALVGGLITYFSGISKPTEVEATPTPVATSTPVSSPTPVTTDLKRSDVKLQVLNGSGVSGLAGKVKTYLEGLGYKDVATGNADSSDYAQTELQVKDSKKSFSDLVSKDLSKDYTVSSSIKTLNSSNKYDIIITLGKK